MNPRCEGRNRKGEPCQAYPVDGSRFCFMHSPERAADRAQARRKGGRNRQTPPAGTEIPPPPLRTVGAILTLLEQVTADTLRQANSAQRSRTLGYLCGLALKAVEVSELEERLKALEERLNQSPSPLQVIPR